MRGLRRSAIVAWRRHDVATGRTFPQRRRPVAEVVDKMDAGLDTPEKWLRIRVAESVERLLDPVFDRPDGLAPLHGHQQLLERLAKRMRCRSTLGFELGHLLRVAVVVVAHLFLSTRAWRPTFSAKPGWALRWRPLTSRMTHSHRGRGRPTRQRPRTRASQTGRS